MNIAIVDDRPEERETLKAFLTEYSVMNRLDFSLYEFPDGESFLSEYVPFTYTVVFLDIYMGGMTGVETAEKLRKTDTDTPVIFLTTSKEHMGNAFSIHAFDYITKPAVREKLFKCMDDLLKTKTVLYSETFHFSQDRTDHSLPFPDIVSVNTAEKNYLNLTDRQGNTFHIRMTFAAICKTLETDSRFLSINRGILVNMDFIIRFEKGCCLLKNGGKYPVYTKKAKETEQKWQNYIFNRIRKSQKERGKKHVHP